MYPKMVNFLEEGIVPSANDHGALKLTALILVYSRAHEFMVSSLYHSGRYSEMLQTSLKATKTFQNKQDYFLYAAALAAYRLKQFENARGFLQQSLVLNPQRGKSLQLSHLLTRRLTFSSKEIQGEKEFLADPGIDVSDEIRQPELFFYPPIIRFKIGGEEKLKIM